MFLRTVGESLEPSFGVAPLVESMSTHFIAFICCSFARASAKAVRYWESYSRFRGLGKRGWGAFLGVFLGVLGGESVPSPCFLLSESFPAFDPASRDDRTPPASTDCWISAWKGTGCSCRPALDSAAPPDCCS